MAVVLDGAGTRWIGEFAMRHHHAHRQYAEVKDTSWRLTVPAASCWIRYRLGPDRAITSIIGAILVARAMAPKIAPRMIEFIMCPSRPTMNGTTCKS